MPLIRLFERLFDDWGECIYIACMVLPLWAICWFLWSASDQALQAHIAAQEKVEAEPCR